MKQKFNGVNKRINHLLKKCFFLHDKVITELRLKDFEDFAFHSLSNVDSLSWDTFTNYMTAVRTVLDPAASEKIIYSKPDTTLSKKIKESFTKKKSGEDLSDVQLNM